RTGGEQIEGRCGVGRIESGLQGSAVYAVCQRCTRGIFRVGPNHLPVPIVEKCASDAYQRAHEFSFYRGLLPTNISKEIAHANCLSERIERIRRRNRMLRESRQRKSEWWNSKPNLTDIRKH